MMLRYFFIYFGFTLLHVGNSQVFGGFQGKSNQTSQNSGFKILTLSQVISLAAGFEEYTVREGDTLYEIASNAGISLVCLEANNPQIQDPNLIFPGEIINIPGGDPDVQYTVLPGDSLYSIASRFGVTLEDVENDNPQIVDPDVIFPGQIVNIPNLCAHSSISSGLFQCGDAYYTLDQYTCYGSTTLCPIINESPTLLCGRDCYLPWQYTSGFSQPPSPSITPEPSSEIVVIGGTSFTIGSSSFTVTQQSQTLIIGPSGILVGGSDTVPLPTETSPLALTTDGITLTFEPQPIPSSHFTTPQPTPSPSGTIIIGGSTLAPGSGSQTLTLSSETVAVGQSSIIIGSDTFAIPTQETTLTTDGVTLTFEPPSKPSSSLVSSEIINTSITNIDVGGSGTETITVGSETVIIEPSGSGIVVGSDTITLPTLTHGTTLTTDGVTLTINPVSGTSGTSSIFPSSSLTDIEVGGSTFEAGNGTETIIVGSQTVIIDSSDIVIGSDTITIPVLTSGTTLTTDGITLTLHPEPGSTIVSQQPSPTFTGVSTITTDGHTITVTGFPSASGPSISLGDQSTTQTGKYVTSTLSIDLSTYSQTTTTEDGHTTILPIWPCLFPPIPLCAIILIPPLGLPIGGLIPPPPCQPAIAFGPNGLPTPKLAGGDLCVPTFTVTQTTKLSSIGGGLSLIQEEVDVGYTEIIYSTTTSLISSSRASSSRTSSSSLNSESTSKSSLFTSVISTSHPSPTSTEIPPTTIKNAPATTIVPSATAVCQQIGLRNVNAQGTITIPPGDTGITISLPEADAISGQWTATIGGGFIIDPKTLITFWQVDNGPGEIPLSNGNGGSGIDIKWSNPTGATNTRLTLLFTKQSGILSFGITIHGTVACTPIPPTPTKTSTQPPAPTGPNCPEPPPSVPTAIGGGEQDLICTDSNLASRIDCLNLPNLPAGSKNGITAADCLPNTSGTNGSGQLYCSISVSRGCSMVMVFGDSDAQKQPQSRDDLVAILNNSNQYCFRVCDAASGPLEGSSILNIARNVRVCIIDTNSAGQC
ncbi:hypothetical protein EYC84_001330 [Monilinia fructicola]|uniref:LysM domain-containing protein n=1 Tax=Monilinia fructicola TaxID=38448 RepID=A0A5M9JLY0_MONFR|nr:hypothetical protein EYC84_001330 [Monilinia fructicola]